MHTPNRASCPTHPSISTSCEAIKEISGEILKILEQPPIPSLEETHKLLDAFFQVLHDQPSHSPDIWNPSDYKDRLATSQPLLDKHCNTFLESPPFRSEYEKILSSLPLALQPMIRKRLIDEGVLDLVLNALPPQSHQQKNFTFDDSFMRHVVESSEKKHLFSKTSARQKIYASLKKLNTLLLYHVPVTSQEIQIFEEILPYLGSLAHLEMTTRYMDLDPELRKKFLSSLTGVNSLSLRASFFESASQELLDQIGDCFSEIKFVSLILERSRGVMNKVPTLMPHFSALRMVKVYGSFLGICSPQDIRTMFHSSPYLKALILHSSDFSACSKDHIQALFEGLPIQSLTMHWVDYENTPLSVIEALGTYLPPLKHLSLNELYGFSFSKGPRMDRFVALFKDIPSIVIHNANLSFEPQLYRQIGEALAHCEVVELSKITLGPAPLDNIGELFAPLAQVKTIRVDEKMAQILKKYHSKLPFLKKNVQVIR